jgi:putative colanic acid biosynthesis acetyltransferase WcaF
MPTDPKIRLDLFTTRGFDRGRSTLVELVWLAVDALLVRSWLPGSQLRIFLLKSFGAQIGPGVRIKPHVRIKFPWRLQVEAHSWIGEDVWIDNLAPVIIGAHCCVSQGAYLCTGSHDLRRPEFDLVTRPITLGNGAWVCARACVGPGVTIGEGAVLAFGSVATKDLAPWTINSGTPAVGVGKRTADT